MAVRAARILGSPSNHDLGRGVADARGRLEVSRWRNYTVKLEPPIAGRIASRWSPRAAYDENPPRARVTFCPSFGPRAPSLTLSSVPALGGGARWWAGERALQAARSG